MFKRTQQAHSRQAHPPTRSLSAPTSPRGGGEFVLKYLVAALLGLSALVFSRVALAQVPEIKLGRQFSMGYLQFNTMEHHKLIEKHAKALGLPEIKVSWLTINGPDNINAALL